MQIDGLLFDKDGTLYDFQKTWSVWATTLLTELFGPKAAEVGHELGFDLERRTFVPHSPIIAETTGTVADLLLRHLSGWERPQLVARMKEGARATPLVEAAPLVALFTELTGRGLKLGLATNDDESSARRHLEISGLDRLIPFVAGYDSGWGGKPESGQMRAFLDWAALPAGRVAMVGDSRHDLAAGRDAGMHTIGVLTGPATAEDLADLADVVLPDIRHLPEWLDGLARTAAPAAVDG